MPILVAFTNLVFWSDGSAMQRCRPPHGDSGRKDPFAWGMYACADLNNRRWPSPSSPPSQGPARCDGGDGRDGRCLLFTSAKAQICPRHDHHAGSV